MIWSGTRLCNEFGKSGVRLPTSYAVGGSVLGIVLDKNYHGHKALAERGIHIPAIEPLPEKVVNLGVLNVMPKAHEYEIELISAFAGVTHPLRFIWIRIRNHGYSSTDPDVLAGYQYFDDVVDQLDGLILTGAAVEKLPFEEVRYWPEMVQTLEKARKQIKTTLGICWGGLALAKILDIPKDVFDSKLFGVFPTDNLINDHKLTGCFGEQFPCPVSTNAGISDATWEQAAREGKVRLLAHASDAGYLIAESADGRFLMHVGHPEYSATRLPEEYARDCSRNVPGAAPPQNVDLHRPVQEWARQSDRFFQKWVDFMAEAAK